jgi:glycosyltransferase involved in cell wall biosynthesis
MAKPPTPRDAVSVVIPVHNAADRLEKVVPAWGDALARLGRGYEILIVDDGSTDGTPAALEKLAAGRVKNLRTLRHDTRRGFGACLRTALAEVHTPLFFYTSADYPYTTADLRKFLERIEVRDEVFGKQPDLISGCRTGRHTPDVVYWFGKAWRLFWRVTCGMNMQPLPAWPGTREYLYNSLVGWVFGVPLADVNSAFKLYRTAFLRRFPIQSDGDFVHTELVAKATFLTSIMDELPLTAPPTEPPEVPTTSVWGEMWRVFKHPDFGTPAVAPTPPEPEKPSGPPVSPAPSSPAPVT